MPASPPPPTPPGEETPLWKRINKSLAVIGGAAALAGIVFGAVTLHQQERSTDAAVESEDRERQKDEEEKNKEAGPPVEQAIGAPAFYGSRFAFPDRTTSLDAGGQSAYGTPEYADWFRRNHARPVGVDAHRVTLSPLHKGTVVIQSMRITDRTCRPTRYTGTAVVPPPIGDGGEDVTPTTVAFDLTERTPVPRALERPDPSRSTGVETWQLAGNAFSKAVYLDGGEERDARTFDLYFFTGGHDCEFKVEANITSGSKDAWYPLKIGDKGTVEIAGQTDRYESVVMPRHVDYWDPVQHELRGPGNPFDTVKVDKESR